jgi:hypothetical protein
VFVLAATGIEGNQRTVTVHPHDNATIQARGLPQVELELLQ